MAVDIITSNSLNVEIISELIVINESGLVARGGRAGSSGAAPAAAGATTREHPTQTESREALTNCIIITQSTSRVERSD